MQLLQFLHLRQTQSALPYLGLLVHSFATISFFVFINAMQAFLLTAVYAVPAAQTGIVTAQLTLADELTSIAFLGVWGVVSDRLGRRVVLGAGYAIAALGLVLMPFGKRWDAELVVFRIIFAIGSSALGSMMTAILGDVVQPKGLPRASSAMGIASGVGALCAAYGYLKLGAVTCVQTAYVSVAVICLGLGVIVVLLFRTSHGAGGMHQPPATSLRAAFAGVGHVLTLARKNPNLMVALAAGFAARTASVVPTSFLSLWVNVIGVQQGLCTPGASPHATNVTTVFCGLTDNRCSAAVGRASSVDGILNATTLVFAPIFAIIMERACRTARDGVVIAAVIGMVGYYAVAGIATPWANQMYGPAVIMGMGQIAMIIASQVLVMHSSADSVRGALAGTFSLVGGVGVVFASLVGGALFDQGRYQAPFVLVGVVFTVVLAFSGVVWVLERKGLVGEAEKLWVSTHSEASSDVVVAGGGGAEDEEKRKGASVVDEQQVKGPGPGPGPAAESDSKV